MDKKNLPYLYIFVVSLISAFHLFYSEYIPLNYGFGFEGYSIYLPLTKNFDQLVSTLDSYTIQRILPFAIGWSSLTFFNSGTPISDKQVFVFWIFFNYMQIILICAYWHRISCYVNLGKVACLTGFAILILIFPTSKIDYYCNFSYDRTALLFGIMVLYYYITNNVALLLITSILSLAVWPTFILTNTILLLFPVNRPMTLLDTSNTFQKHLSTILSLLLATTISLLFFMVWKTGNLNTRADLARIVYPLLPISIILSGVFVYSAIKTILDGVNIVETLKGYIHTSTCRLVLVGILVGAYLLLTKVLANSTAEARMSFMEYFGNVATGAVQRPLQFIIAHILYFGPGFFLLMVLSRKIVAILHSIGLGMTLIVLFIVIQCLNSESRQMINLLPVIALLVAIAIDKSRAGYRFLSAFIISSIIISKVWLRINPDPSTIPRRIYQYFPMIGDTQLFPAQKHFMNFGPWISTQMLIIQSIIVILLCSLIYVFLRFDIQKQE